MGLPLETGAAPWDNPSLPHDANFLIPLCHLILLLLLAEVSDIVVVKVIKFAKVPVVVIFIEVAR